MKMITCLSTRLLLAISLLTFTRADYECVCNNNVELEVKDRANGHGDTLGYMYEFDCKPKIPGSEHAAVYEIMFEGQIGFVSSDGGNVQSQTCPGAISAADLGMVHAIL
ncbi:hypothetical protein DPMN_097633 [Dreissena polymorpha]|uniref:Uncharacterized protein n=1 Tax=Dreissena polymorpha TaxID=45954 RepID=A0A9D4R5K3_DREPO|nr:hypothetical protein DPMN_097633 [Dreissena polymorpha]